MMRCDHPSWTHWDDEEMRVFAPDFAPECDSFEAKPWPECSNCGEPAKWLGTHPDAGGVPVCGQCVGGQGFKNLRLYSEILKRPMPSQNAEVRHGAKDADLD
jgi:hypothetical protein